MNREIDCKAEIDKLLKGNNEFSGKLYNELLAFLHKKNKRYRVNKDNINDIAQNSVLLLLLNLKNDKFRCESTLSTYAIAIAKNQFFRFLDREEKFSNINDPNLFEQYVEEEPDLFSFDEIRWRIFNIEFENLNKECRRVLRFVANRWAYEDIAKKMKYKKTSLVKEKVYRCRIRLNKLIKSSIKEVYE